MKPTASKSLRDDSSIRRLGALLRPYLSALTTAMLILVGLAAVNMVFPLFIKLLIDDIFPERNWGLLWLTLAALVLFYLVRNVLYFFSKTSAVRIGEHVCFELRNRLFDRLQHMTLRYYRHTKPGSLSSRVMDDSFLIQTFIQDDLPTLLMALFLFVGLVAVLFAVNWQLALAATVVLPFHFAAFRWFKRPIKATSRQAQEQLAVVHGNLIEKFLGMEVVKGFTGEARESEAFVKATNLSRINQLRSKTYHVTQKVVGDLLVGVGTIGLLGFGAYQVMWVRPDGSTRMDPGQFFMFFGWVGMLYPTVLELMSGFAKFAKCTASIDRVFEMLEAGQPEDHAGDRPQVIHGHLVYDSVCVGYTDGTPVLKNVSLEIKPGQVCAIVGPSGAGKSTMVSLVPRFMEPDLGRVMLDGVDIATLDMRHLRDHIGIAFQECFLFNSSILENLKYASPNASMKQIKAVARRTGAHDFISRLADGYDTILGESGVSLSRGEKQRINLTRAMLKNPRILILDEATASIDTDSEAQIIPAILEFMRGKTTLMITHRHELLRHADVVVRLEDGRVTFHGTPAELARQIEVETLPAAEREGGKAPGRSGVFQAFNVCLLALTLALGSATAVRAQEGEAAAPPPEVEVVEVVEEVVEVEPVEPVMPDPPTSAAGQFLPLPGMNALETQELVEIIAARAQAELGYRFATTDDAAALPTPEQLEGLLLLTRRDDAGTRYVQLGFRSYRSQPRHLWLFGQRQGDDNAVEGNPDMPFIDQYVADIRRQRDDTAAGLEVGELASEKIKLSYVDAQRCIQMLQVFGYTAGQRGTIIDVANLPVILEMAPTTAHDLIRPKNETFPLTDSDPISELIVFYNPARPEQFSQVLDIIRGKIDVAARQIMIEAMVLEISDTGLKRLGVQWELENSAENLTGLKLGTLPTFANITGELATLDIEASNIFGEFQVRLQALIREGFAEVMSRPSVLTLDNRMAYINVAERIPVVNSIANVNSDAVNISFTEKIAGITLNVRPRVAANGEEISMQVVAAVTARVPNADVIVRNSRGEEIARSPTISEREVRTYTRIGNNMPFIIGGLVARDDTTDRDKVPILGDVPFVGALFRTDRTARLRREVIIVITPYLLPENPIVARNLPKDDDAFDSFGNRLFRDAYRIRAEDVFDLRFLHENRQLMLMQALANRIALVQPEVGGAYPVNRFAGGRIPGEEVLVYRQMYEVIKRRNIADSVSLDKIIFFEADADSPAGFDVRFLWPYLINRFEVKPNRGKGEPTLEDMELALAGKAVAFTYTIQPGEGEPEQLFDQPVPRVQVLDCPDNAAYSRLLWSWNQPDEQGRRRFTVLLRNAADFERLRRAIVVKQTANLNANRAALTLENFSLGRQLLIPTVTPEKVQLIDDQTARFFFYTEQYYPVVRQMITRDVQAMRELLANPVMRQYLHDPVVDDRPGAAPPRP